MKQDMKWNSHCKSRKKKFYFSEYKQIYYHVLCSDYVYFLFISSYSSSSCFFLSIFAYIHFLFSIIITESSSLSYWKLAFGCVLSRVSKWQMAIIYTKRKYFFFADWIPNIVYLIRSSISLRILKNDREHERSKTFRNWRSAERSRRKKPSQATDIQANISILVFLECWFVFSLCPRWFFTPSFSSSSSFHFSFNIFSFCFGCCSRSACIYFSI